MTAARCIECGGDTSRLEDENRKRIQCGLRRMALVIDHKLSCSERPKKKARRS